MSTRNPKLISRIKGVTRKEADDLLDELEPVLALEFLELSEEDVDAAYWVLRLLDRSRQVRLDSLNPSQIVHPNFGVTK